MRIRSTLFSVMLIVMAMLPPAASAAPPNMVLEWNQIAAEALVNAPTASPPGAGRAANVAILDLAIVQGAVYDAVNSIDGGHQPLIDSVAPAPATASKEAAAATAAHNVLVKLAPPALPQVVLDRVNLAYTNSLAGIPDSQAKTDGIAAGAAAATAMLTNRANDGRTGRSASRPGPRLASGARTCPPSSAIPTRGWPAFGRSRSRARPSSERRDRRP